MPLIVDNIEMTENREKWQMAQEWFMVGSFGAFIKICLPTDLGIAIYIKNVDGKW